jgi:signal transduction histidine kinase
MLRRITLLAAGAALLAVVLFAIPLGIFAARGYLNDERLELQRAAASAAALVRGELTAAAARSLPRPGEASITLYDAAGKRLAGPGPAVADPTVQAALRGQESTSTTDAAITVAAPVSDGDRVTGAVVLAASLGPVHHRAIMAWLALAAMGLLAVALAGLVARVIARRLAAPLDRLTDVARKVGEGDLTARAAPSDVPEIDVLAATLNASTGQLEARIARERRFSAEVSHQLRTPLTGLRLELEGAYGADGAQRRESVERALETLDRLDATITEVITLARDLPAVRAVAVDDLVSGVERRWHGVLAAASRPLRLVVEAGAPATLPISPPAVTQIVDVLIANANVHGRGAVTVVVRRTGNAVAVDVQDEGPPLGIEPPELFRRRPGSDGHGIGLPFARRLAEAEGARLVLSRAEPPTFSLVLASEATTRATRLTPAGGRREPESDLNARPHQR